MQENERIITNLQFVCPHRLPAGRGRRPRCCRTPQQQRGRKGIITALLLERCRDQRAKLVITSVGKSGIAARTIAATFSSIRLMAVYLNHLDYMNGDLGVLAPEEVCLLLSKSGETAELLEVMPHLKRHGTARIALVGRSDSSVARG